jgi:DtxR family Mn-dependent transcriptional regulator
MNVQMSSVTSALKNLRDRNLVNYEKNAFISLTPKGKKIAEAIKEKHDIIKDFLHSVLMLPKSDSDTAACEIEHAISTDTALRLKNCSLFIADYLEKSGISEKEWDAILSE